MTVLLSFLAPAWRAIKPFSGYILIVALCGLALWGVHHAGYRAGVKHEQDAQAEALAKAEKRVKEAEKKAATITTRVEVRHAAAVEKIRTVTQTLIKEVPYAVPSDPARASLSVGFVRLHDAAATGLPGLPDPAGRADAEASGIGDADLARTLLGNYEACHVSAETVTAWQSWVVDQAALYNRTIGAKP
jgi:hypothetical protein